MSTWDKFQFSLLFRSEAVRDELLNIEAYRLSLSKLHLPSDWRSDLQHLHIVRSVHGTTAIEGNPLTEDQIARQLSDPRRRRANDQVHRQIANAEAAFQWIEKQFATPRPIQIEDIRSMHRLLTQGSDEGDNEPGKMRTSGHNVTVGSPQLGGVHRPPPGGMAVSELTLQFVRFINSRKFEAENIVVRALVAHFYFVTLHPFGDGNGRTTRCIEAAILYAGGYNIHGFYSLSNFFYRNRDDYFRHLQEARTRHGYDLTEFLRFGLRGFREELERINTYVRNRTHRLHYREMIRRCREKKVGPRRRLLNEREAAVLHRLLDLTAPPDPFSDDPAQEATLDDVGLIFRELYHDKTQQTVNREFYRLSQLGFIRYERRGDQWQVLLRFEAIEQH